jgi:hypothetical protein
MDSGGWAVEHGMSIGEYKANICIISRRAGCEPGGGRFGELIFDFGAWTTSR